MTNLFSAALSRASQWPFKTALMGAVAASMVVAMQPTSMSAWLLGSLLLLAAVSIDLLHRKALSSAGEAARAEIQQARDEGRSQREAWEHALERLSIELFPIFARHIEHSRQLTEESIVHLSQTFSGPVTDLEQVIQATRSAMARSRRSWLSSRKARRA
ncbi:hypothetical protein [Thiorhodococcus minor]|uniref:Uncharacterized protein n=1 Tax=Thiorhodococcus minor TaxID=57489 RepID=A0A6M0JW65_9GAMM|nr:hypothetical protein [Thiorhodococcus minor]NEV61782.1 hypothetical protein [Thiorhodococcus minor]